MFQKGTKRSRLAKKKQFRRPHVDDDDDTPNPQHDTTDETDSSSTLQKILKIKKRRTLIRNLEQTKGISTVSLLQSSKTISNVPTDKSFPAEDPTNHSNINNNNNNTTDQLDMTKFGVSVHGEGGTTEDDYTNSVMGAKHKEAMEHYIRTHQTLSQPPPTPGTGSTSTTTTSSTLPTSSSSLYDPALETSFATTAASKEGDVGAGGAMLGGTGIAEVMLPMDHRLKNIQETVEAANAKEQSYHHRRREQQQQQRHSNRTTSNSLSDVGASYSHNFQLHNQDWIQKKIQDREMEKQQSDALANEHTTIDKSDANQERIGFEARRRTQHGSSSTSERPSEGSSTTKDTKSQFHQRSSDDRVWGSFVKSQKKRGRL